MTATSKPKIGRFEVLGKLGGGMQGKVYLGWDPKLQRKVALKVITHVESNASYSQEVIEEARIAARISHPNVVPIYEAGVHRNAPVLIFEYVDGIPLKEYLKRHGELGEKAAVSIMVRIADGLKQAHEQGIMHLDLSPNNVMIDKQNRPRIMDFGLARVIASIDKQRQDDGISGTPRYMSPEHFTRTALSPATDIFALGLVFYELLAGIPAMNQARIEVILNAVANAKIDWSPLHKRRVSAETIAVLRDMLHVDPACRYKNAAELVEGLDEVIAIQRSDDQGRLALAFLLRRLQRRPEFPAFSQSVAEINRLTADDALTGYNQIGSVILRDYSLTNRVMKIANSAFFDRGTDGVKTISQAIARLGLRLVRMICNGLMMFDQADDHNPELKDSLVASFVSGLIARHVARGIQRQIAEEAFICGLFHNLGNNLLMYYLADEYEEIQVLIAEGKADQDAERSILSTTTASLGMAVAGKWNFPDTIIDSMRRLPIDPFDPPNGSDKILCHVANFAHELCHLVRTDVEPEVLLVWMHEFTARHHGVYHGNVEDLADLLEATAEKFAELAPGLGVNCKDSVFFNRLSKFVAASRELMNDEEPSAAEA